MSEKRWPQGRIFLTHTVHGSAPAYLTDELYQVADVEARQRLRSSLSSSSIVSRTGLPTDGDRAFPVAAARVWNSLPVTSAPSVAVFRYQFKIKSKSNASLIIRCFIIRCLFATQAEHE